MSAESWPEGNAHYLSAALTWLRLRLAQQARPAPASAAERAPLAEPAPLPFVERLRGRPAPPTPSAPAPLPAGAEGVGDEQVAQAAADMAAAESQVSPPPAVIMLSQRLGLSRFEREVLLLCAATELDTRIVSLCARAQDDPARLYPTFALALALFDDPAWDALSPERPLRYWRLIEINQPGNQSLTASALRADERIVNYIKGLNYLDDRLAPLMTSLEDANDGIVLPPSQRAPVETILQHLEQANVTGRLPLIQLIGPDSQSKQLVAWHVAAELGLNVFRLPAALLPSQAAELETLARLWQRESLLLPVALYLDAAELEGAAPGEGQAPLQRFLARSRGILFLDTREIRLEVGRVSVAVDVAKPTPSEQRAAWAATLGSEAAHSPLLLASQFNLNLVNIRRVAQTALAKTQNNGRALHERLWDACLVRTRPRLDALAQRLDPKATWDDIVLPEGELRLLRQIADQVGQRGKVYDDWGFRRKMNRGLGISALFAGESGTGKTMAAEVIANDLRLNLYRIDLSAVVSKYIGETEKNLRRLFDAAEDGGAILFFDEADALFGKRSEVKDSHDRYANIEINYLLQRMEAYRGLAILATNMKSALDTAFMRRLRFIVNFPFPGLAERKAIWQKVFPTETPTAGLDFARLARFNLTGGSIHNIAINAAFLAAQAGSPVSMSPIFDATRAEFRKLEKPINEADFRA